MDSAAEPKRISRQEVTVVSARPNFAGRLREIWRYRELLLSLVRKELKIKYKDSFLGFIWSLLNPMMRLVIFYFVFKYVLQNDIPLFAIYLLSGLLVWTLFSEGLGAATGSVVGNGNLVKKVSFPREILPLASIGAAVVNFFLQITVLLGALAVFRHAPSLEYSVLLVPALLAVIMLGASIGLLLSALNVRYRDTGHLVDVLLLFWFWMTPILYNPTLVFDRLERLGLPEWLYFLNPMVPIVMAFQRAIYNTVEAFGERSKTMIQLLPDESIAWYLGHIGIVMGLSVLLFGLAMFVFGRMQGDFAEEL